MDKIKTGRGHRLAAALMAALVFALGLGLGVWAGKAQAPIAEKSVLDEVRDLISSDYLGEADPLLAEQGLSKGVVEALNDPYSVYFTPEELAEYLDGAESRVVGIGAYIRQDRATGETILTGVLEGGPAQRAGLREKDRILAVDGEKVEKRIFDLIVKSITGEAGTTVALTVFRPKTGETLTVHVQREAVVFPMVRYKLLGGDTGYLQIIQFGSAQMGEFYEAVDALEAQGIKALVIDLRGNPGGSLDAAVAMADYLMPDRLPGGAGPTVVVTDQDKHGNRRRYYCNDGRGTEVPIALLTDQDSASASEVLAAALRDNGRALLVGEKTFGKGIVQTLFDLPDGGGLKLTTRAYSTPSGFSLNGIGLEPDIPAEVPELLPEALAQDWDPAEDTQLQTALKALGEVRAGRRALPAFAARDEAAQAPAGYLQAAQAAGERLPSFDLSCAVVEKEIFPALLAELPGAAYSRGDDWEGDGETAYARTMWLQFVEDGPYLDFTADPVTEGVRRAELSMPAEQAADHTLALLERLSPGMKEAQREKLRVALLDAAYSEDGSLPEIPGGVGCRVYAATEENGYLTVVIER